MFKSRKKNYYFLNTFENLAVVTRTWNRISPVYNKKKTNKILNALKY